MSARDVIAKTRLSNGYTPHGSFSDAIYLGTTQADAILSALDAAGFEIVYAHKWEERMNLGKCCVHCGIVHRTDGRHLPCLGPVHVRFRHAAREEPTT